MGLTFLLDKISTNPCFLLMIRECKVELIIFTRKNSRTASYGWTKNKKSKVFNSVVGECTPELELITFDHLDLSC